MCIFRIRNHTITCTIIATGLLVAAAFLPLQQATAHHGTRVAYDWTKSVVVTGVITEFAIKNPHSFLMFDVTDEDGSVVNWGAEMASLQALKKMGLTRDSLGPGDEIQISLYPSRAGAPRGQHIAQEPLLINGVAFKAIGLGAAPAVAVTAPDASAMEVEFDARNLTGVWRSLMRRSFMGKDGPFEIAEPGPMTPEGLAKYESQLPSFGPRAIPPGLGNDPWGQCNPPGLVRSLLFGAPIELIHGDDKLTQLFETTGLWRTIPSDGRELPTDREPSWMGYSVGRWDGDTFVIETTGFDDRLWLDSYANPVGSNARLVERWTRVDHGRLELEMTLHDSENYSAPVVSPLKIFHLQPGIELGENICAPFDEYTFNEKIRDPASGRGVIATEDWEGESGYEEGSQRAAWESDLERMRSESKN